MASPRARWRQRTTPRGLGLWYTNVLDLEKCANVNEMNATRSCVCNFVTSASLLHHGG